MVGTFRAVKDGDAVFYEFWVIEVDDGKAIFKMKHFDRGLVGWEDKADMVRLALSVSGGQDVFFSKSDGSLSLRYRRNGDELVSTLRRVKDGKTKEDIFHLHRSKG
jgi:phage FluMu gp28-like protein